MTRYQLNDMPDAWYNAIPELPEPMQPPLHPGTREPLGPDDLTPLFPMGLIMQEAAPDVWISIPGEVIDILRLWRPTPLVRAERLERIHHVLADLDPLVVGEVEVARAVVWRARRLAVGADLEEEELQLRAHVHLVAELCGALHLATQHAARIAGKRLAVRQHHVADDARGTRAALRRQPRQHAPRVHVGAQQLIGFGDPREALDRRSVEPGAVLDRTGHLMDGDLHALHGAVDVHELRQAGRRARGEA